MAGDSGVGPRTGTAPGAVMGIWAAAIASGAISGKSDHRELTD